MKTLDKSKPYGTVHGMPGILYEQGGAHFNGQGNEVGGEKKAQQPPAAAEAKKPEPPTQVAQQLGQTGGENKPKGHQDKKHK